MPILSESYNYLVEKNWGENKKAQSDEQTARAKSPAGLVKGPALGSVSGGCFPVDMELVFAQEESCNALIKQRIYCPCWVAGLLRPDLIGAERGQNCPLQSCRGPHIHGPLCAANQAT